MPVFSYHESHAIFHIVWYNMFRPNLTIFCILKWLSFSRRLWNTTGILFVNLSKTAFMNKTSICHTTMILYSTPSGMNDSLHVTCIRDLKILGFFIRCSFWKITTNILEKCNFVTIATINMLLTHHWMIYYHYLYHTSKPFLE